MSMELFSLSLPDLVGTFVGFVLTLMVFSYIFGDNLLFRFAMYVFIGVAAGYAAAIVIYNVIWPQLFLPILNGRWQIAILPLVLSILLAAKIFPRYTEVGSPVMAFLVGTGAAIAVGGAVMGTLFPQASASMNVFDLQNLRQNSGGNWLQFITQIGQGTIMLLGTLSTLAYFHFGAKPTEAGAPPKRALGIEIAALLGKVFIAVTFGSIFAGVYIAALTAMVERMNFLVQFILAILTP